MATHYFGSHQGGIEIVAGKLFREFATLEQEVVWVATDATPPPSVSGTARVLPMRASNFVEKKTGVPFPIPTLGALKKLHNEVRCADVVIVHDCLYLTNIAAFALARLNRIPVLIIQHIGLVPYANGLLRAIMRLANTVVTRPMLRSAQQVVFISETTKRYFGGLRFRTPPAVIFNGVDTDVFRPLRATEKRADIRRSLGLPPDPPVILFVGRFVEKKGLPVLKRLVELGPAFTWAFAGWGPLDPRRWKAANVFVFSDLRDPGLAELYRASDLFVLPSTGEGFPLVIQEAIASGLPVVCGLETASADPASTPFVHGVRLEPGDEARSAAAFMAVIEELMSSEPARDEQSEKCRSFALSRYSWRRAAERYVEIASRLISQP
jgi:glycosyltransferase involved in cell wall biosynthesis